MPVAYGKMSNGILACNTVSFKKTKKHAYSYLINNSRTSITSCDDTKREDATFRMWAVKLGIKKKKKRMIGGIKETQWRGKK